MASSQEAPGPEDLVGSYAEAGFGGGLGRGTNRAILLVDFVNAYLDPASPLFADADAAKDVCAALLQTARNHGAPVFFTAVVWHPGDHSTNLFARKVPALRVFEPGQRLAQPPPELEPLHGEPVIEKRHASGFFGTDLASQLRVMGVDALVIAGVSTSGCIRATALDALQHGFVPLVVADGCADRDPRPHESNLFDLQAKCAEVIESGEAKELLSNPRGLVDRGSWS